MASLPPTLAWLVPTLILIWAAAYVWGMRSGIPNDDRSRRLTFQARLSMIAVHLALALLWLLGAVLDTPAASFAGWIVAAMFFDALGDLALAGIPRLSARLGRHPDLVGLGLFAAGHMLFVVAIFTFRSVMGITGFPWLAIAVSVAFGLLLWFSLVKDPARGGLNTASLPYALFLSITTGLAADLALRMGALWPLALGLLLFTASDLLLAQYLIRRRSFAYLRDVVWLIYGIGQILIAFSIGEAAILLAR